MFPDADPEHPKQNPIIRNLPRNEDAHALIFGNSQDTKFERLPWMHAAVRVAEEVSPQLPGKNETYG